MPGNSYLEFEIKPKPQTKGEDMGRGQVNLQHLGPALFLELQLVKLHTHRGVDSRTLEAAATPEMVKGYRPQEREEHGVAEWTGVAAASGTIVLTFSVAFKEAPEVFVTPRTNDVNVQAVTAVPTTTGVNILWKDDTLATHTSVPIAWLAKGR